MSGLNLEALVDFCATYIFVRERTTTTLHNKPKSIMVSFKVVNTNEGNNGGILLHTFQGCGIVW